MVKTRDKGEIMRVLDINQIDDIFGGKIKEDLVSAIIAFIFDKTANAVASSISDLNQGGTPNGTTAMGENY
jgi:hypothetical protein